MTTSPKTASRPIHEIAREIRKDWKNVNYAAKPYLDAMGSLDSIQDSYGADSAKSIVLYFLSNATTWKGEVAKKIKAELKAMASGGKRAMSGQSNQKLEKSLVLQNNPHIVEAGKNVQKVLKDFWDKADERNLNFGRVPLTGNGFPELKKFLSRSLSKKYDSVFDMDDDFKRNAFKGLRNLEFLLEANQNNQGGRDRPSAKDHKAISDFRDLMMKHVDEAEKAEKASGGKRASDAVLRQQIQRIAAEHPETRVHLVPLLRRTAKTADVAAAPVAVGSIFYSSWGYDQTNVDFYEVVKLLPSMIVVRAIDQKVVGGEQGSDQVVAVPHSFRGPLMKKRVGTGYPGVPTFKVNSYSWAHLWDGKPKHQTAAGYGH